MTKIQDLDPLASPANNDALLIARAADGKWFKIPWSTLPLGGSGGGGDMLASVYDPQNIDADAFDRANHTGTQAISTVSGLAGALVPVGGTTGQLLAKASATDRDTEWVNPPSGGGASVSSGRIEGASGTITATAGSTLMIWGAGNYTGDATPQSVDLNYNASVIHTVTLNTAARTLGFSLLGRVTAVASGAVSITVPMGSLVNPAIMWLEIPA